MKSIHILHLYVLTLIAVFALSTAWEFLFESLVMGGIGLEQEVESNEERWEYVITVMIFIGLALIIPSLLFLKIISQQQRELQRRAALENELNETRKLESIGQLAGGIAHEINTPIQYIGNNLRFLQEAFDAVTKVLKGFDALTEAARAAGVLEREVKAVEVLAEEADLDYILAESSEAAVQSIGGAEQVARIVLAMKEFSHPSTREKAATDINRAIGNTVTVCRNEWKHVADLDTDLDAALPPVMCLAGEVSQVFLNLVVNAAHAIRDGCGGDDEKGRITVSTRRDGAWLEVRVADTGTGIPAAFRDKVFDPFFTTKEVGKGSGQGLAICRDIVVNRHGGEIFFETEMGTGTTFVVRLPMGASKRTPEAA